MQARKFNAPEAHRQLALEAARENHRITKKSEKQHSSY